MGSVELTVKLDLEKYSLDTDYSCDTVRDHIIFALKHLFGEIGAALPFQVESVNKEDRTIKIVTDNIFLQKIRCALTLQNNYQGIKCCFSTVEIVKRADSD